MSWIVKRNTDPGGPYLTLSQMQNNATEFATYGASGGWSLVSMAGMLGSIEIESTINPGIEEVGSSNPLRGIGLCQWTGSRHTELVDFASQHGYNGWWYGECQMDFLLWEMTYKTFSIYHQQAYDIIPPQFRFTNALQEATCTDPDWTLEMSVAWWTDAFEKPGSTWDHQMATRLPAARYWYSYLGGQPLPGRKLPVWMLKRIIDALQGKRRL